MASPNIVAFGERMTERFQADDPTVVGKTLEQRHVASIKRQLNALAESDFAAFAGELHPDVELEIYAPREFPFIRQARGIDEFRRAVEHNFGSLAEQRSEFLTLIAQGDLVAIFGRERGEFRATGKSYDVQFAYEFTFQDGKIVRTVELAVPTAV